MAAAVPDVGAAPASIPGPASILLAEHEPEVAEMSARYLRRDGLRVRLVTAPELALAELSSGPDAAAHSALRPTRPVAARADQVRCCMSRCLRDAATRPIMAGMQAAFHNEKPWSSGTDS